MLWSSVLAMACFVAAACGGDDVADETYAEYFRPVEVEMVALEQQLGVIAESAEGQSGEALGATLGAYAAQLQVTAGGLDEISAPGDAREPHDDFVIAFRYLAEVKQLQSDQLLGNSSDLTEQELSARAEDRADEWFTACHDLQDFALVHDVDVDLRCVTALHRPRG